jgi:hypothetical protein
MENPEPLLSPTLISYLRVQAEQMTVEEFKSTIETFINVATMLEMIFERRYPAEAAEWNKHLMARS